MEETKLITVPLPKEGILMDIVNPKGESVLVVSREKFLECHKKNTHPVNRQFCCIKDEEIVAAAGYEHTQLIPVIMDQYEFAMQCEEKGSKWR